MNIRLFLLYLFQLTLMNSSVLPLPMEADSQFFMTEIVRVKRQAGYVYNKPSISFDLPARAPPISTPTQAPNVDRPQAQQMMFYAYPAPPSRGNSPGVNVRAPTAAAGGRNAQTTSTGTAATGYNYAPQSVGESITSAGTGSVQTNQLTSSAGYGYNAPSTGGVAASSASQSSNSGSTSSAGYGYSAPSTGGAAVSGASQSSNSGSSGSTSSAGYGYSAASTGGAAASGASQSSSSGSTSSAGYGYSAPTTGGATVSGSSQGSSLGSQQTQTVSSQSNSVSSGYAYDTPQTVPVQNPVAPTVDVSTSAPRYLPPKIGDVNSNVGSTTTTGSGNVENVGPSPVPEPISDQYLPPLTQSNNQILTSPGGSPNTNTGLPTTSITSTPNAGYIPPSNYIPPSPPQSIPDATPRPFAPPPVSEYLPPNSGSGTSGQSPISTPASTYLPPI